MPLCTRCSLPVGEFSYQGREGRQTCVHTECMAQILSQDRQVAEDNRVRREDLKKQKNRQEYDIGWRMDSVPKNMHLAERMGCSPAPQGLCCLVLDEASRTVKVAATSEPSASINLEYLLLALKVRRTAKREPLFSLDPVDPHNLEKTPQKKVYEPSWLAGTSVGDVMFQADYFLKELALGEYSMPVRPLRVQLVQQGKHHHIPVVPGQAGGGSFQKEKKYIAQKEFAYRMCARRPTSAMPKSFLCCERAFCRSMVVMFCALK